VIVELSLTISDTSAVYPGVDKNAYDPIARMDDGDLNNATFVRHFLHTGTHVDAPFHFDNQGARIDQIPIEDFVYHRPLLIDVPKTRGQLITASDLAPYAEEIRKADLVLFHTGFIAHIDDEPVYQDDFPAIDLEVARMFRDEFLNVVAVSIDTLSIESIHGPEDGFPVHLQLLHHEQSDNRPLLVYENTNTLPLVGKTPKTVWALPIRFAGTEAAPVAMIAEVD